MPQNAPPSAPTPAMLWVWRVLGFFGALRPTDDGGVLDGDELLRLELLEVFDGLFGSVNGRECPCGQCRHSGSISGWDG